MTGLAMLLQLALLQPEPPKTYTSAVQFFITTGLVMIVFVVAISYIWLSIKKSRDSSIKAELDEEFEKSKEALLIAAQQKKASKEREANTDRAADRETREMELLKENVEAERVIGQTCPLSRLEMMEDQELVIDPYTGQGYHFSSFLNDWPAGQERPKYVYRYPQATIVRSENLVRDESY